MKFIYRKSKFDLILVVGFSLIVLLFSSPLLYLSFEFNKRFNEELDFVRSELNGTEQVKSLFQQSELLFNEKTNPKIDHTQNELDLQKSFSSVNQLIAQIIRSNNQNKEKLKRIEMIFSVKDYQYSLNKRKTNSEAYSYLQRKLNKALVLVADESKLLLDPESFTYHLMELSLLQTPKLIVQLLELSERVKQKEMSSKELFDGLATIEEKIEEMTFNVDSLKEQAKNHTEAHSSFDELVNQQNLLTEAYIELLFYFENIKTKSDVINADKIDVINADKIDGLFTHLGKYIYSIHEFANLELQEHLQERFNENMNVYRLTILFTVLIWILSVTLSTFLFISIVRKRQSMQSMIEQQKDQLAKNAKLALLGEMATGIGHEIASPLTVISGQFMSLERKMTKYPDEIKADLDKVIQRGHKMVDRINFIIKSMKGYAHQTEQMELKPILVNDAIEESLVLIKAKAMKFGIELHMPENIPDQLFVLGTESEVCQCILNLISNGIDAVSKQSDRKIDIFVEEHNNQVLLKIQDNGPGVPSELKEKIFESLFSTKQVGEGTGLGLSLVSRIMSRLGGRVELLESRQGACFQLTFQKARAIEEVKVS